MQTQKPHCLVERVSGKSFEGHNLGIESLSRLSGVVRPEVAPFGHHRLIVSAFGCSAYVLYSGASDVREFEGSTLTSCFRLESFSLNTNIKKRGSLEEFQEE